MELEPTQTCFKGCGGQLDIRTGKVKLQLQCGDRRHEEGMYFSNIATATYLSVDACKVLGIVRCIMRLI